MAQTGLNSLDGIELEVGDTTVAVSDGQKIGSVLRNIAFINGHSKEDAQKIHREHIQFHIEDDHAEMEVLGENPTVLDGESLSQGDRVEVMSGATIELSEILEATVRIE
jgi:hypothetical protein